MSLISAAVCVGVMSVMSTLEIRAVWAMAGRGKLRHGINFRFVCELRSAATALHNKAGGDTTQMNTNVKSEE